MGEIVQAQMKEEENKKIRDYLIKNNAFYCRRE